MSRSWLCAVAACLPLVAVWMSACGTSNDSPAERGTGAPGDASTEGALQVADAPAFGSDADSEAPHITPAADGTAPDMGGDGQASPGTDASPTEASFDSAAEASSSSPSFEQGASATSNHASTLSVSASYPNAQQARRCALQGGELRHREQRAQRLHHAGCGVPLTPPVALAGAAASEFVIPPDRSSSSSPSHGS